MAPLFVGSNSDDSRIRSDRVGLAASTSNPASADAGDAYYNSTDNALKIYSGSDWSGAGGGGTLTGIASGAITDGQPVIIQSNGTIAGVGTTGVSASAGTKVIAKSGAFGAYIGAGFDSHNNRVVFVFRDDNNSSYGTAVVGSVTGTSISFGTPVTFNEATTNNNRVVFDSTNNKIIVIYTSSSVRSTIYYRVGTVDPSDNSISFGSQGEVAGSSNDLPCIAYDSNAQRVVVAFNDNSSSGKAIVGSVSGNTISWGSAVTFISSNVYIMPHGITFDSSNNKIVIVFKDYGGNGRAKAVVGTVSGTSISFGSVVQYTFTDTDNPTVVFDSSKNKLLSVFSDQSGNGFFSSGYDSARVGTVTGTGVSFGSQQVWDSSGQAINYSSGPVYVPSIQKTIIGYRSGSGGSDYGLFISAEIKDNSVSFGSTTVWATALSPGGIVSVYDDNAEKVVFNFSDNENSSQPASIVVQPDTVSTNLTSTNFLGISNGAYSDGSTVTVQIEGSVDDAQSGLTVGKRHYVQNDGSLGITTGDFAVSAGIAISTTKIAIES